MTGQIAGLRFFHSQTLGWDESKLFISPLASARGVQRQRGRAPHCCGEGLKPRVLLMTTHSAGLRVSELVNLKIKDIDPKRMMIRVEQGKCGKDRYTILSKNLLTELHFYWKRYRPSIWLFPNRAKNGPLSTGEAWHIYNEAKKRAGLRKGRGIHTLRHALPPIC